MSTTHEPATPVRVDAVVALVRLLAARTEPDPAARLADLAAQRAELDAEMARVRAGTARVLDPAEERDLRRVVEDLSAGLRAAGESRAVADVLLSPARRTTIAALLARVGMDGAHHEWLAAAMPTELPAPAAPAVLEPLADDVDDSPELGEDPVAPAVAPERLTDRVRQVLRRRPAPLADLLEDEPLTGGLSELVGWMTLADDAVDVATEAGTEQVAWSDAEGHGRIATLPRIVYRRAGTTPRETLR